MKILSREISHYEVIPKGYGCAYYKPEVGKALVCLIPLNLFVRLFYHCYVWVKSGFFRNKFNLKLLEMKRKGYDEGYREALGLIDKYVSHG